MLVFVQSKLSIIKKVKVFKAGARDWVLVLNLSWKLLDSCSVGSGCKRPLAIPVAVGNQSGSLREGGGREDLVVISVVDVDAVDADGDAVVDVGKHRRRRIGERLFEEDGWKFQRRGWEVQEVIPEQDFAGPGFEDVQTFQERPEGFVEV